MTFNHRFVLGLTILLLASPHWSLGVDAVKPVKRPAIVGVAGITLRTADMAATRKFYTGYLGFREIPGSKSGGTGSGASFEVNERQIIEVVPGLTDPSQDRVVHVAFETTDAEQLRAYLASREVEVPGKIDIAADGSRSFIITAPEGHDVKFVQFAAPHHQTTHPDNRVSKHMVHVGFIVNNPAAQDHLFKDILGFEVSWHGGMKDEDTDWINVRVPEGHDWLEYMLNVHNPDPTRLGNVNHIGLGVDSVKVSYEMLLQRGASPRKPIIGRDGKWQVAMVSPDLTRVETMEFKPVETPCCSPILP